MGFRQYALAGVGGKDRRADMLGDLGQRLARTHRAAADENQRAPCLGE